MATMIPEYSLSEFRKLKAAELKRLQSCEVTSDGVYLFSFVNPQTDYIRDATESLAQLSNAVGGLPLEDISKQEVLA